jgi:hypothetical protein
MNAPYKAATACLFLLLKEYDGLLNFSFRPGKENTNADILSRISLPDDVFIDALEDNGIVSNEELGAIQTDEEARKIMSRLVKGKDGIRRYKERIYVPEVLRRKVMKSLHGGPRGSHIGSQKLLSILVPVCYWPNMQKNVCEYVQKCGPCTLAKTPEPPPAPLNQLQNGISLIQTYSYRFYRPFSSYARWKKVFSCRS